MFKIFHFSQNPTGVIYASMIAYLITAELSVLFSSEKANEKQNLTLTHLLRDILIDTNIH